MDGSTEHRSVLVWSVLRIGYGLQYEGGRGARAMLRDDVMSDAVTPRAHVPAVRLAERGCRVSSCPFRRAGRASFLVFYGQRLPDGTLILRDVSK